jgi:ankyrin repeat protein
VHIIFIYTTCVDKFLKSFANITANSQLNQSICKTKQPIDQRRLTANSQGKTGLMFAAAAGHRMVVRLLLQHHADPNAADALGRTAMHHAAMEGKLGVIEELDRFGGDLHLMDAQHNTPLHLACKKNKFKVRCCCCCCCWCGCCCFNKCLCIIYHSSCVSM